MVAFRELKRIRTDARFHQDCESASGNLSSVVSTFLYGCEIVKVTHTVRRKLNSTASKVLSTVSRRGIPAEA